MVDVVRRHKNGRYEIAPASPKRFLSWVVGKTGITPPPDDFVADLPPDITNYRHLKHPVQAPGPDPEPVKPLLERIDAELAAFDAQHMRHLGELALEEETVAA